MIEQRQMLENVLWKLVIINQKFIRPGKLIFCLTTCDNVQPFMGILNWTNHGVRLQRKTLAAEKHLTSKAAILTSKTSPREDTL